MGSSPQATGPVTDDAQVMPLAARRALLAVAVLLHLGIGVLYLGLGLVAPLWAVVTLWAAWVVLLVVLLRVGTRRPPLALLVPVGAVVLVLGSVSAGEAWLGWTA